MHAITIFARDCKDDSAISCTIEEQQLNTLCMLLPSLQEMIVQYCAPLKNNKQQQQLRSRTSRR